MIGKVQQELSSSFKYDRKQPPDEDELQLSVYNCLVMTDTIDAPYEVEEWLKLDWSKEIVPSKT